MPERPRVQRQRKRNDTSSAEAKFKEGCTGLITKHSLTTL